MRIVSIRYSRYVGSVLVVMGRRVVVLFVFGVGKCSGRLKCKDIYGEKAESALTETHNSRVNNEQTNLYKLFLFLCVRMKLMLRVHVRCMCISYMQ